MPPIPSLFAGVLAGGAAAMIAQGSGLHDIFTYANSGYAIETGIRESDSLLNRGGIQSMMWAISLVLKALGFGGAREKQGGFEAILVGLLPKDRNLDGIQIGTAP